MSAPLKYVTKQEDWNFYQLEDGTTVRIRVILTRIARNGEDANGNPAYQWEVATLGQVEPAEPATQKPQSH